MGRSESLEKLLTKEELLVDATVKNLQLEQQEQEQTSSSPYLRLTTPRPSEEENQQHFDTKKPSLEEGVGTPFESEIGTPPSSSTSTAAPPRSQSQRVTSTRQMLMSTSRNDALRLSERRESLQECAAEAVVNRQKHLHKAVLPERPSLRDTIRSIHAHSRRELPLLCELSASMSIKKKLYDVRLDRDAISYSRRNVRKGFIDTDDVVGASLISRTKQFIVVFFVKGKGKNLKALMRRRKEIIFQASHLDVAKKWVEAIQELVRWQARVPPICAQKKRKIKVVINPHSGKNRAPMIWENEVKPLFELADLEADVENTTYGGHAIDMGKNYSPSVGYEAIVFISGDGTICEYMNGLLERPHDEWSEVVATTPLSLISAGTQNAFGTGVGIPTVSAAVYCIIKRKLRPMDVITATSDSAPGVVSYSTCGIGWGVAGDVAAESERYRSLGTKRYAFLKLKRGLFKPKKHTGRLRYIPTKPAKPLRQYFDIRNEGVEDQHIMEEGNIYDEASPLNAAQRKWGGSGVDAVRHPANEDRYAPSDWVEEEGRYVVVGALNVAPDALYSHPSDGSFDLIITRKGSFCKTIALGLMYLFGKETKSSLIHYVKAKALIIDQDEKENKVNIDGEVLEGPGPFRMEIIPSLFKVLSEK